MMRTEAGGMRGSSVASSPTQGLGEAQRGTSEELSASATLAGTGGEAVAPGYGEASRRLQRPGHRKRLVEPAGRLARRVGEEAGLLLRQVAPAQQPLSWSLAGCS